GDAIATAVNTNAGGAVAQLKPRVDQLKSMFKSANEGEVIALTYIPGTGTVVAAQGGDLGTIQGKDFADALFGAWIGTAPVDGSPKTALPAGPAWGGAESNAGPSSTSTPGMLQGIVLLWFVLTAGAVVFVVWDSLTNTPTSWVQQLAWILVTIYTGPIGLFVYLLACRSPGRGLHDVFTRALWKQGVDQRPGFIPSVACGLRGPRGRSGRGPRAGAIRSGRG